MVSVLADAGSNAALLVIELGYLLTIHIHHRLIGGLIGLAVIFQGLAVQIDRIQRPMMVMV